MTSLCKFQVSMIIWCGVIDNFVFTVDGEKPGFAHTQKTIGCLGHNRLKNLKFNS